MDSTDFERNAAKARGTVKNLGQEFELSKRKAERFAEEGLRRILPVSPLVADAMINMTSGVKGAAVAWQLLARVAIPVAVGLAAFEIGKWASQWTTYGKSVAEAAKALEEMRKAQEIEREFLDGLAISGHNRRVKEAEKAAIQAAAVEKAAAQESLDAVLKMIAEEEKARQETTKQQLAELETVTQAMQNHYAARAKMRADFEAGIGKGGFGGGAAEGFSAIDSIRKKMEEDLRQLAFLEREGRISGTDKIEEMERIRQRALAGFAQIQQQFSAIPAVMALAQTSLDSINVNNLGVEFEKARVWVNDNIATLGQLRTQHEQLQDWLQNKLPAAITAAVGGLNQLTEEYIELAWAMYAVNVQNAQMVD